MSTERTTFNFQLWGFGLKLGSMFPVDLVTFSAILLFGILLFAFVVRWYYDRRDRLLYDHRRYRTVFYCIRCGKIYSRSRKREISVCPHCGFENTRMKF